MNRSDIQSTGEMWTDNNVFLYITELTDKCITTMLYKEDEDNFWWKMIIPFEYMELDVDYWDSFVRYTVKSNFVVMVFESESVQYEDFEWMP